MQRIERMGRIIFLGTAELRLKTTCPALSAVGLSAAGWRDALLFRIESRSGISSRFTCLILHRGQSPRPTALNLIAPGR